MSLLNNPVREHTAHPMKIERTSVPDLDCILGEPFAVLDHGFVRCIDYMGDDAAIVQAARVSYGKGTETPSSDRQLIRYLMRHLHTTPFEMCEVKLHVKLPIFAARQWIRHRTANVNEYSGRYSIMPNEFYMPTADRIGVQSSTNRQGTGDSLSPEDAEIVLQMLLRDARRAFDTYDTLAAEPGEEGFGVSRELARIGLPLSTYTEFYWKTDLHNLFHFLKLRDDPHAQAEIRAYADPINDLLRCWVPLAFEAYVDYRRDAVTLSRMEFEALRRWIALTYPQDPEYGGSGPVDLLEGVSDRERREFVAKFMPVG